MIAEATPAPRLISFLLERSANRPKSRPPINAASPEAMMNPPSPVRLEAPDWADKVTKNGGLNDETSRRLRTVTKCRNGKSSRSRVTICLNQLLESGSVFSTGPGRPEASPAGSRIPAYTAATATHKTTPKTSSQRSCSTERSLPPTIRMISPRVTATRPAAVAAKPLTCPRCPFGTVRPWTSLDEIEHKQRPNANTAKAATISTPAVSPSANAAVDTIAATAIAWIKAPATKTHLRYRTRRINGFRNACGSIGPASRIGTSRPVSAGGTPNAAKSQGRTLEALTTWSPEDCKEFANTRRSPLGAMEPRLSAGSCCSASGSRWTRVEYKRSVVVTIGDGVT